MIHSIQFRTSSKTKSPIPSLPVLGVSKDDLLEWPPSRLSQTEDSQMNRKGDSADGITWTPVQFIAAMCYRAMIEVCSTPKVSIIHWILTMSRGKNIVSLGRFLGVVNDNNNNNNRMGPVGSSFNSHQRSEQRLIIKRCLCPLDELIDRDSRF